MNIIEEYYKGVPGQVRESIQTLYTNLQFASIDKHLSTITMTSTLPDEGKTTNTCFLGIAMADMDKRVLIVEADLRKPQLANAFGKRSRIGLVNYVVEGKPIRETYNRTEIDNLYYVDMGMNMYNPVELFHSQRFANYIKEAREDFDCILFDTPPLLPFIDAAAVGSQTDGVLLTIKAGKSDQKNIKHVVDQLAKVNARLLGVVLSSADVPTSSRYAYSYYNARHERRAKTDKSAKTEKKSVLSGGEERANES